MLAQRGEWQVAVATSKMQVATSRLQVAGCLLHACISPGKLVWKVLQFNLVHVFDSMCPLPLRQEEGLGGVARWQGAAGAGQQQALYVYVAATCCTRRVAVSQPLGNTSWPTSLTSFGPAWISQKSPSLLLTPPPLSGSTPKYIRWGTMGYKVLHRRRGPPLRVCYSYEVQMDTDVAHGKIIFEG